MKIAKQKYSINKIGKTITDIDAVVEDIIEKSKNFIKEKTWGDIIFERKYIKIIDVYDEKRIVKVNIKFVFSDEVKTYSMIGIFKPNKNIDIRIRFKTYSIIQDINWEKFFNTLKYTINHEIGHAKREIKKTLPTEQSIKKGIKARRYPLEFDADISAYIDLYNDYVQAFGSIMTYDQFFDMMKSYNASSYYAYTTPKWRKKVIKRLAREGIILER